MELSLGVGDPNQAEGSLLPPGSVVTLPIITGEAVTSESDGTTTIINVPIVRDGTFLNAATLPASQGLVIATGPDGTGTVYLDPSQVAVLTQNAHSAINFVPIENANVGESGEEPRSSELPQQQTARPPVNELFEIKPPVGKGPFNCSLCGKIFPKWNQLQRHVRNHAFDKPHRCDLCDLSFNVESNLVLHKATHNSNNPTCPECKRRFSRMASFKAHIMMHEKEESLMCNECGDEFSTLIQLDKHMRYHQDEEDGKKVHTCKRCNSTFGKASLLRDHMKVHYKIKASLSHRTYKRNIDRSAFNHKCNTCGKTFQKPSQLERHFRIHTGERPYTCVQCNKAFNQKGALQIHLTKHSGERPHRCEFCPAAFSQKGNLRAHIQRVHVIGNEVGGDLVMYSCEECTCVFKKLGSLNAHVSRMHSDDGGTAEKPSKDGDGENGKEVREVIRQLMDLSAQIPDGDEGRQQSSTEDVLGTNSDLLQQALQNSGLTENQDDPSLMAPANKVDAAVNLDDDPGRSQNVSGLRDMTTAEEQSVARFPGPLPKAPATHTMSYADTATGALKKHLIRKVAGIRWHQCLYCCKEFKKPSDLVRHIRIHTHEKPYKCGHCYRSFTVKSTLTAHLRTHTGIKNYRCQVCNKLFSTQGSLKVHLRLHTGAKPFDCPHCDKRFRTSGHRKSHLVSHSKDGVGGGGARKPRRTSRRPPKSTELSTLPEVTLQEPILITDGGLVQSLPATSQFQAEGPGPDRPYVCLFCSRAFKKSSHLKQHTRSHTGEKPYQCSKCLRCFVSGGVLKAHLRTHTGVRAYRCHICESAFTTNGSLKRHLSIHSEMRPFMCPYCQKTFKTSVNCKKHMKTHKHELALQAARATSEVETRDVAPVTELGDPTTTTGSMVESALHGRLVAEATNEPSMDTDQTSVGLESRLVAAASATLVPQGITLTQENLQQLFSDQTPLVDTDLEPKTLQVVPVGSTTFDHQTFEQFSAFSMPPDQLQQTLDIAGLADTFVQGNTVMTGTTVSNMLSTQESGCQTLPDELEGDNSQNKGEKRNYKCTYCSKCFKKSSHLKQHVRTHTGEKPFKCIQCHRMFVSMGVLRAHLRTHTGARDFKCHICQATFTTNGSLTRHKMIHSSARPFKCQYCCETFRTTVHYKRHLRTHSGLSKDDQVHPSTEIGQEETNVVVGIREEEKEEDGGGIQRKTLRTTFVQFSDEQTVNLAKQPPEECATISEKILFASAVEKDRVSEIKDKREELQRLPRYPHTCKVCPKSFKKPSDLVRHTRIHTGEKPFKCSQCDKCFTVKSTLDSHLKTHSGEKHFNCHVCNSMFATKGSLKVHMRLHTGAKPFKCPHCDQRFRTSGHRKSHITTHFKTSNVKRIRRPSTARLGDRSQHQPGDKIDDAIQNAVQSQTEAKLVANECDVDIRHVQAEEDAVAVVSEQAASGLLSCDDFQNQGLLQSVELLESGANGSQTGAASMLANITLSLDGLGPDASQILDDGASEIQIAGLDGSSMITQTIQIDANLLQQLQQQGNINITINSILPPGLLEERLTLGQGISSQPQGGIQMTSPPMVGGGNIIYQPMNITFPLNTQPSQVLIPVDQGAGDVLSVERHDPCFQMALEPTVGVVESNDKDSMEVNLNIMESGEMVTKVQAMQQDGSLETDHNSESRKLQQTPASRETYRCQSCNKLFKRNESLREHMLLTHGCGVGDAELATRNKVLPHCCSVCQKRFAKPSQLERHTRIHTGERPFECSVCHKTFNQTNALQVHMSRHTGERPHKCPYCQMAFSQKGNLNVHVRRVHGEGETDGTQVVVGQTVDDGLDLVSDIFQP